MEINPSMRYRKVASTHELAPPLFDIFVRFMAETRPDAPDHVASDWVNAFKTGRVWNRLTASDQEDLLSIMVDIGVFNAEYIQPGVLSNEAR